MEPDGEIPGDRNRVSYAAMPANMNRKIGCVPDKPELAEITPTDFINDNPARPDRLTPPLTNSNSKKIVQFGVATDQCRG